MSTAVSQLYYWAARSVVTLRKCLNQSWQVFAQYWIKQAGLLCIILAAIGISNLITKNVYIINAPATFLVNGVLCEVCFVILAFICCHGIEAERRLERIVIGMLLKSMRRKV